MFTPYYVLWSLKLITALKRLCYEVSIYLYTAFHHNRNEPAPEIVSNISCLQKPSQYNLRQQTEFGIPSVQSVYHGSESISYLGLKAWNLALSG